MRKNHSKYSWKELYLKISFLGLKFDLVIKR